MYISTPIKPLQSHLYCKEKTSHIKHSTYTFMGGVRPARLAHTKTALDPPAFLFLCPLVPQTRNRHFSTCCSRSCWKRAFACESQSRCTWGTVVPHQRPAWFVARGFPTQAPLRCRACSANVRPSSEFQRTQSLLFVGTLEVVRSTECRPLPTGTSAVIGRARVSTLVYSVAQADF